MGKSWRTTTLGVLALIGALAAAGKALLDGDPATMPDLGAVTSGLAGLGLIFARDANVSSEGQGIK